MLLQSDPVTPTRATTPLPMADAAPQRLFALMATLLEETRGAPVSVQPQAQLDTDLGIDSLTRVELGLRIEREFGVRLRDEALMQAATPADVQRALEDVLARAPARARALAPPRAPPLRAAIAPITGTPEAAGMLPDVLAWHVARHPQRCHTTFLASDEQSETLSYGALDARARRIAAGLAARGLQRGQTCGVMLATGLDFFSVFIGILMVGAIPVPIYPPFRLSQLEDHMRRQARTLANCGAAMLVSLPEARLLARLLKGTVPSLRQVVTPDDVLAPEPLATVAIATPDDIAFLQYTSGSTGNPKGVILTHANLLANLRAMGTAAGATSSDVFMSWLPLYHDMGLIGAWMASLYYGIHLVLMAPQSFLARPARWLWAIHRHRATISAAPNFAYELVASRVDEAEFDGLDLSSLRWAFNGAEAVSAGTLERFTQRFRRYGLDPLSIAPVYGLAECGLDLAFPPRRRGMLVDHIEREALALTGQAIAIAADDPRAQPVVANGRVLPGYAIRIADEAGRSLPQRRQGRVEFRGPSATRGYFNNPQATAQLIDGEWLDTGDLGYLADQELYITGRAKDLIIRGGHNIHPHELEEAVGEVSGVRRGCVAVFGVPDERNATERVIVLAETREQDGERRAQLRATISRLANDLLAAPADEVVLAPPGSVLKTSSGKIRRAATRDSFLQGRLGSTRTAVWWQVTRLAASGALARMRLQTARALSLVAGAWCWFVFGLIGAAGLVCAFAPLPVATRRKAAHALARYGLRLAGVRLDVIGVEQLPAAGAFVIAANHASYIDSFILTAALPPRLAFVAKGEYRRQWLMRRLLGSLGTRFVERFDPARGVEDTRELVAAVRRGESLVMFPEGTFRRAPELLPLRMGTFIVAAECGVAVVPVSIFGTRAILPADTWLPRPGAVKVNVAAPIVPRASGWDAALALRDETSAALAPAACTQSPRQ